MKMLFDEIWERISARVERTAQSQVADAMAGYVLISREDAAKMLRRCLGDEYLAYLLNANAVEEIPELMGDLPRSQLQMLTEVMVLATPVLLENPDYSTLPGAFCCPHGVGVPLQNHFRMLNGGVGLSGEPTGDKLVDHMQKDAALIFPTLSMLEWGDCRDSGSRFQRLYNYYVETEDDFTALFSRELIAAGWDEQLEEEGAWSSNEALCVTTTMYPIIPVPMLGVKQALLSCAFYGANTLDYRNGCDRLRDSVRDSVDALRTMLSGEEVDVPALIVLEGVKPSEDEPIQLEDGLLRLPTDYELRMVLPRGLESPLVFVSRLSERLLDLCPSGQVFGGDVSKLGEKMDVYYMHAGKPEWYKFSTETATRLQMAILLASDERNPAIARMRGFWLGSPIIPMNMQYSERERGFAPWELKVGERFNSDRVVVWYKAIVDTGLPEVTMYRIITAFSGRGRPLDSVVDLLIALESLLGSSTEISFKLSLFVAKLLHPNDAGGRTRTFELVKEAYDVRSATVHGGNVNHKKHDEAQILGELCAVVVQLVRVLLSERRDLLELTPQKRAIRVTLE